MMAAFWFSNTPDAAQPTPKTTAAKQNLGKAAGTATLTANENCRETSDSRQISASTWDFSYRNTAHWLTETPLPPPFPSPPVRPTAPPAKSKFLAVSMSSNQAGEAVTIRNVTDRVRALFFRK